MIKKTYMEKHVEELTNRVLILEKMVAHLLYSDPNIKDQRLKIPYPTPKKVFNDYYEDTNAKDELFDDAWIAVSKAGKASVSYLQRILSVGYNRACKIVDQLTKDGIIEEPEGIEPRKVLKKHPKA